MTGTVKCFDASAAIPREVPDGCKAVLGYIGTPPGMERLDYATHAWTLPEWQLFGHLLQFPCWVANLTSNAAASGRAAAAEARRLGWHHSRAIVGDFEAAHDPAWWDAWSAAVKDEGYKPVWYGSLTNAAAYDADLKWLALYDHIEEIPHGYAAKQYAGSVTVPGGVVDLSVVGPQLLLHAGHGPRKLA